MRFTQNFKFALFFCAVTLALVSCEKEIVNSLENESISQLQDPISESLGITGLRNGHLVFKDINAMKEGLREISSFTEEELNDWEKQLGFTSIRRAVYEAKLRYEQVTTAAELDALTREYADNPYLQIGEYGVTAALGDVRSAIVPFDQVVYFGESLVKFKPLETITIADGDEDKLLLAERTAEGNADQGIFISRVKTEEGRTYCPLNTFDEDKDSDNDKRLRYWVSVFGVFDVQGSSMFTEVFYAYQIETMKKSGFIWKRTWIDLDVDATIQVVVEYGGAGITNSPLLSNTFNDSFTGVSDLVIGARTVGSHTSPVAPSITLNLETISAIADRVESPNTNDLQCQIVCF